MAAALHPSRNETGPNVHAAMYPGRALMTELDFKDNRYPTLSQPKTPQRASALIFGASERSGWDSTSNTNDGIPGRRSYEPPGTRDAVNPAWAPEQRVNMEIQYLQQPQSRGGGLSADMQSLGSQSQQSQSQSQSQEPQRSTLSYALPPGAARRVVERYSLDDNNQRAPSRGSAETRPVGLESTQDNSRSTPSPAMRPAALQSSSVLPATSRHQALPASGVSGNPANGFSIPLSASPSYNPPIAPNHRAYAQQPTYITPPTTPTPIQTVYSPRPPPPQEEVCVECAMRDQDMADVDVTSPGVWERESDAAFEELKRREQEDEEKGLTPIDDPKRPRVKGGRLTEQNVKLWLSVNPREPASRQQTLKTYIKSQRLLLEAEALAHARAMQEAKQLDSRMRDTYSQLRRSAYDMGSSSTPADDLGGVRIKPPLSPSSPTHNAHARSHSREITLLENGMIVEHVDVRREEREARERKRKEERRARKSSRSSTMDVTSMISANSFGPAMTDGGLGLHPTSRYSQASSPRPTSVLTAPLERPDLPRAYSQASFSDVHSLGSQSPRRTRFFGFKNLSGGFRSQDSLAPSGMSGSMVDMHVALQREAYSQRYGQSPADTLTPRTWQPSEMETINGRHVADIDVNKPKKKKGLAKIWGIVTGVGKHGGIGRGPSQSLDKSAERTDDDLPLAPPPPLSYLVNRGPSDLRSTGSRIVSPPSINSTASLRPTASVSPGMSPSTGPSSILPSPASSRLSGPEVEIVEARNFSGGHYDDKENQYQDETIGKSQSPTPRNVHPVISEPDMRQRLVRSNTPPPPVPNFVNTSPRPPSIMAREKSLPPLPGEAISRPLSNNAMDPRPRTVYTYDPRPLPPGSGPAHDFLPPSAPFRTPDTRRQSFGGLSSRPSLAVQTMPMNAKQQTLPGPRKPFGVRYDEFGYSRRSLGPLDSFRDALSPQQSPATATKRKSRFGFASLLGRKSTPEPDDNDSTLVGQPFPVMRRSGSDGQDDLMTTNGYATSTSRHSALSTGLSNARMSVASRKALEERVAQDPEFVAYRYPSNDQRLDLLR
ncbi:hypothetical protein Hypma_002608 [Hypsizygus marmoreus]|uniref:Uncharacterized protein n=1 Tax=Hypsizygus marmoreus TaxID=39966 RepID=A0A369JAM1_HYPMA|nr:hypothetical protein Hypma_002608 [Hypsizygus marmoreus]